MRKSIQSSINFLESKFQDEDINSHISNEHVAKENRLTRRKTIEDWNH